MEQLDFLLVFTAHVATKEPNMKPGDSASLWHKHNSYNLNNTRQELMCSSGDFINKS